jgi:4-aminobutyrate aminotransferase-like enzyme/Ser/Thr protein kinase RdoA (MazF antagonist)
MLTTSWTRPAATTREAERIARDQFGLVGTATELPSERDRNFLIATPSGQTVLKIAHADEERSVLEFQHRALERIAERAPDLMVPRVVRGLDGRDILETPGVGGESHLVRMLSWLPGTPFAEVLPHSSGLLQSLGATLGRLDLALEGFSHPQAGRVLKWDIVRSPWVVEHLPLVEDPGHRALVTRHLERFEHELLPMLPSLRQGVIHNDANDWNVLVGDGDPTERRVSGLLDFGDMLESPIVMELAIACAYAILAKPDPMAAAADVVRGYHDQHPLAEDELELLFPLICTRLSVSVVNAAVQRSRHPDNSYLAISEAPAWDALERLEQIHPRLAYYTLRAAADLEPCPLNPPVVEWLNANAGRFGPLLDMDGYDRVCPIDLSVGSPLVENPAEPEDMPLFTFKLFHHMMERGAEVGIGAWNEPRVLYLGRLFEGEGNDRPVPRTIHLGLDLFCSAGIPVLAPLDGIVHGVRDNAGDRDYGPTVILRHEIERGPTFFTLYGHLGRDVIGKLQPGTQVRRGDWIGTVGGIGVNGGWPPHPHVQIICDLLDREGEFPGVARADQRDVWLSLSPDANLIAGFPDSAFMPSPPDRSSILRSRQAHLGPSLSISYRKPLHIVRGWKQFLYDQDGLGYLDCVNNVPHVGHSHPQVVRAAREQLAVLNTNTRYLHEHLVRYAERLTATLPEPLSVCFLVNSGSEANELAIRMARAATGQRGMVVLDVGYHGNTTTLIDVSPYKHDGKGGAGPPSWVRKIPMPDGYRGAWKTSDPEAGSKYAAAVSPAMELLSANGEPVAAFLAESILSCGGQVVSPDGFLAEAYRRIRAEGGVCIADEVQVGFGRVGSHFWGFETQGVIPDIVTMGKPIGNGFPLGAVVTTPQIAAAFANGMEYFNTFGGGPVAAAVGLAVLDVMESEQLQRNALEVGRHLLAGLQGLVERHPLAGEARGMGLFVGLELVRDRSTLEPAAREASAVVNRLRDYGLLVSTDGPFNNVIKIKPPMCFARDDADCLVAGLDRALSELRG